MVGLPSQLGKQLVDDICTKHPKLRGCCCAKAVHALFTNQIPVNINQHISNMDFNADTYLQVFEAADRVYLSSKTVTSVAALSSGPHPGLSIAEDENSPLNTAIAAVSSKPKKPKKPKKNKNQSSPAQPAQQNNQGQKGRKGPRHSSNPPHSCCDVHFVHGDQSWFCGKPLSCPWKDRVVERP